ARPVVEEPLDRVVGLAGVRGAQQRDDGRHVPLDRRIGPCLEVPWPPVPPPFFDAPSSSQSPPPPPRPPSPRRGPSRRRTCSASCGWRIPASRRTPGASPSFAGATT